MVDGVGTRFVVVSAAHAVHAENLHTQKGLRHAERRLEVKLREAKATDLRRQAAAITLGFERSLGATMGLSHDDLDKLRDVFTKPVPVIIGEYTVAPVPQDRAIVLKRLVTDMLRQPFESVVVTQALRAGAPKRTRRRGGVPDTTRGACTVEIALQLRATQAADDKDSAERAQKRARKTMVRANKKVTELRGALEALLNAKCDIRALTLSKAAALLRWKEVPMGKPWNNNARPAAHALWDAKKISEAVVYAAHRLMLVELDDDDGSSTESDTSDESGDDV